MSEDEFWTKEREPPKPGSPEHQKFKAAMKRLYEACCKGTAPIVTMYCDGPNGLGFYDCFEDGSYKFWGDDDGAL